MAASAAAALRVGGDADQFSVLTFHQDLEGPAADLAVGGEAVRPCAGVHDDFEALSAVGALNFFGNFHGNKLGFAVDVGKCGVV